MEYVEGDFVRVRRQILKETCDDCEESDCEENGSKGDE